jgi:hypothetical protein
LDFVDFWLLVLMSVFWLCCLSVSLASLVRIVRVSVRVVRLLFIGATFGKVNNES